MSEKNTAAIRLRCFHPVGPLVNGVLFGRLEDGAISEEIPRDRAKPFLELPEEYEVFKGEFIPLHQRALDQAFAEANHIPTRDPKDQRIADLEAQLAELVTVNAQLSATLEAKAVKAKAAKES